MTSHMQGTDYMKGNLTEIPCTNPVVTKVQEISLFALCSQRKLEHGLALWYRAYQSHIKLDFHKNPIRRVFPNPVTFYSKKLINVEKINTVSSRK